MVKEEKMKILTKLFDRILAPPEVSLEDVEQISEGATIRYLYPNTYNLFVENPCDCQKGNVCNCESCNGQCDCSSDNRHDLYEKFDLVSNPKYVAGYQWFCKSCKFPAKTVELWFECKNAFVPLYVRCHLGCHAYWRLHIKPEAVMH